MLDKASVLRRCANTRDTLFDWVCKALSPHLADDMYLRYLYGEKTQLQLLTRADDRVVWSMEYRFQLVSYDAHDGQHWMVCNSNALVATSATGEHLEARLAFSDYESPVRAICSRILVRAPFVDYQWIPDAYDGMKYHLMADDKKVQTIWRESRGSRTWATLMGITCSSKLQAMAEAFNSALFVKESDMSSRVLA